MDTATKVKQLRSGKWSDDWKEFSYWDESKNDWVTEQLDMSLGTSGNGWWPILWHENYEWQPEGLADHLEQNGDAAAATNGSNGYSGDAVHNNDPWAQDDNNASSWNQNDSWNQSAAAEAAPAAAPAANDSWGNAAAAAPAAGDSWGNWGGQTQAPAEQQQWGPPPAKAFWEEQQWNKDNNILSGKEDWELDQDEQALFKEGGGAAAGIDFGMYDNVPVDVSGDKSQNIPMLASFEAIYEAFKGVIPDACVDNVRRCGYQVPTPVQKYAVPAGLAGRDIMCCAQTGSGKTAAFLIPSIGLMIQNKGSPVGHMTSPFEGKCKPDTLVLSPTRELCIQIHQEALKFCHKTGFRCCLLYGGAPTKDQMKDIAKGCDLMVATPGRLNDFIERKIVSVEETYVLVLDEADRMLDMGFEKQIRDIVHERGMPADDQRQTLMFSATFPEECQRMAQDFLHNYIWIGVGVVGGAVTTVTQNLKQVTPKEKYEKLLEALDQFYQGRTAKQRCIVFVNAKDTAKWLDEQLYDVHYDTGSLHGNLTQPEREEALTRFRKGDIDVMIATDVAARGLDIESVDLVINYDLPNEIDTYVHRIGRSGRIGNRGAALTFVAWDETGNFLDSPEVLKKLANIMKDVNADIPEWLANYVNGGGQDSWAQDKKDGGGDSWNAWANWGGKDMRGSWN